jgi:threonine/homoserine/homoserine lactone efflux protein
MAELWIFAGIMALGQFSPGPDMILLTRTALARGRVAGWWTALGISTGLCLHAAVAIGGMAFLVAQGGVVETVLRWAAAAYLGWLGLRLLQGAFVAYYSGVKYELEEVRGRSDFVRGLLCNLLNPKVLFFFAGVVAPFLRGERPDWWPYVLWGILVGEGLVLWCAWVWLLQWKPIRARYETMAHWIDALFGLLLLVLAVLLLLG